MSFLDGLRSLPPAAPRETGPEHGPALQPPDRRVAAFDEGETRTPPSIAGRDDTGPPLMAEAETRSIPPAVERGGLRAASPYLEIQGPVEAFGDRLDRLPPATPREAAAPSWRAGAWLDVDVTVGGTASAHRPEHVVDAADVAEVSTGPSHAVEGMQQVPLLFQYRQAGDLIPLDMRAREQRFVSVRQVMAAYRAF